VVTVVGGEGCSLQSRVRRVLGGVVLCMLCVVGSVLSIVECVVFVVCGEGFTLWCGVVCALRSVRRALRSVA